MSSVKRGAWRRTHQELLAAHGRYAALYQGRFAGRTLTEAAVTSAQQP